MISENESIEGLNVTIPHKENILEFLNTVDAVAEKVGAVNTLKIKRFNKQIKISGYNTDVLGFERSLVDIPVNAEKKALILGTGGASKAIKYVLEKMGLKVFYASRKKSGNYLHYSEITKSFLKETGLIVNATPLGTFPDVDSAPQIPYHFLNESHILYDLVYNPSETRFMKLGTEHGARVKNGYEMLVGQAEESWGIWNQE